MTVFRACGVFLVRKCYKCDVRNNLVRTGPLVIACGCDAAKAAFFMAFVRTVQRIFKVMTDEAPEPRNTSVDPRQEAYRCAGLCLNAMVALLAVT